MNYCANCGAQLTGAPFCAQCGAAGGATQPSARQGLAQAGLEVQDFNARLVLGRIVGLVTAGVVLWFVVGPALAEEPFLLLGAILGLALVGILGGQWVALLLMRR
jgi:hypothetical protein